MRGLFPFRFRGPSRVQIAGSFVTVGASNPTSVRGVGFTVTRTNTGLYTITLQEVPNALDSFVAFVHPKTAGTELFVSGDVDNLTASVIPIIITNDAGSQSDDTGSLVSFIAVCRIGNHNA